MRLCLKERGKKAGRHVAVREGGWWVSSVNRFTDTESKWQLLTPGEVRSGHVCLLRAEFEFWKTIHFRG